MKDSEGPPPRPSAPGMRACPKYRDRELVAEKVRTALAEGYPIHGSSLAPYAKIPGSPPVWRKSTRLPAAILPARTCAMRPAIAVPVYTGSRSRASQHLRLPEVELELAHLVPSHRKAGAVVALDP